MKRTGQKVVATDHPIDILRDRMGTKATTLLLAHLSAALKSNRHSYILPTIVFFHLIIGNIVFLLFTSSGVLFIFALFLFAGLRGGRNIFRTTEVFSNIIY